MTTPRSAVQALAALLVFVLFATACGDSDTPEPLDGVAATIYGGECEALDGRQVTIYSGRSENLIEPVLSAFECETGIETDVRYGSASDLALLLEEEGDRRRRDTLVAPEPLRSLPRFCRSSGRSPRLWRMVRSFTPWKPSSHSFRNVSHLCMHYTPTSCSSTAVRLRGSRLR